MVSSFRIWPPLHRRVTSDCGFLDLQGVDHVLQSVGQLLCLGMGPGPFQGLVLHLAVFVDLGLHALTGVHQDFQVGHPISPPPAVAALIYSNISK